MWQACALAMATPNTPVLYWKGTGHEKPAELALGPEVSVFVVMKIQPNAMDHVKPEKALQVFALQGNSQTPKSM